MRIRHLSTRARYPILSSVLHDRQFCLFISIGRLGEYASLIILDDFNACEVHRQIFVFLALESTLDCGEICSTIIKHKISASNVEIGQM